MNEPYEEFFDGENYLRLPPGLRHEVICERLHLRVAASLAGNTSARLLSSRSEIQLSRSVRVRPDLAVVAVATNKLWLAAEIISSDDHHSDTVLKKTVYEEASLPRLWMIDPRYDNVEVYHGSPHGLALKQILAFQEVLKEPLLPRFEYIVAELFKGQVSPPGD